MLLSSRRGISPITTPVCVSQIIIALGLTTHPDLDAKMSKYVKKIYEISPLTGSRYRPADVHQGKRQVNEEYS